MTTPQNRWRELQETIRHNSVAENLQRDQNAEQTRANKANERLRSDANAIQRYGIDQTAANVRYTADSNAVASKYSADSSRAASKYAANASASASKYGTNKRFVTDVMSRRIQQQQLELDKLNSAASRAKTQAEITNLAAKTRQALGQADNLVKEYALKARAQNNQDAKTKADIAQGWVNSATQGLDRLTHSATNVSQSIKNYQQILTGPISEILDALL